MKSRAAHHTASTLLIVLWALLVLTAAILGWAELIQKEIILDGDANRGVEARAMAHSGITVALNPLVTKFTPLLEHQVTATQGYRVRIISEGGKLNVRWILENEDPTKITLFKQWLELKGLDLREREILTDCLLDYVDPDNLRRANGVEDQGDYHAANRMIQSIDEIARVWGSGPLTRIPGWKDDLTLDSSGPIDITAAPVELLRLIPGLGEPRIQRFLQIRQGPDRIDGTADDYQFKNDNEVMSALGLSPQQWAALNGGAGPNGQNYPKLVMINDPTQRIISEGHSGKVIRQVEVVKRQSGGNNAQILHWKE